MCQLEGSTKKPKEILLKLMAVVRGSGYSHLLDSAGKRRRMTESLRKPDETSTGLTAVTAAAVDQRRSEWLTTGNMRRWIEGWTQFLFDNDFAVNRMHPIHNKMMPYVSKQKRSRIINPDETHLLLSTELEKGGPRASVYSDPALGAAARPTVVNPRHTSMMLATNARHEVLAPYLEFDSNATAENQGVDALWVKELPKPVGFFGNAEASGTQISRPGCEVTPKGGSGKGSFTRWIDKIVEPVYNITPTFIYREPVYDSDAYSEYSLDDDVDLVDDLPVLKIYRYFGGISHFSLIYGRSVGFGKVGFGIFNRF